MRKTHPPFAKSDSGLSLPELSEYVNGWLLDCEYRQHSKRTLEARRSLTNKLLWFLRQRELPCCDAKALRQFLVYAGNGHQAEGGRWGNERCTSPVRPGTVATYHHILRALFNWIVTEGGLEVSPMETIKPPVDRPDQIQPFSEGQIEALLQAAKRSQHPRREEAILLFLLDTGVRASELCALRFKDVDIKERRATVQGKGGKSRPVYFGSATAKALWAYLREEAREPGSALFQSDRGPRAGESLTRNGLQQMLLRLAKVAKIETARVSPHTFRHTFSISFLRNGGNQFSLMQLLGHTCLTMTARYVALAQADVQAQHRQYSPVDMLRGGKRG